ncbi:MAG: hypothetical protein WD077_08340 [Bacteroidia bacterium]
MNIELKALADLNDIENNKIQQSNLVVEANKNWNYSSGAREYYLEYFGPDYLNRSFVVLAEREPVAFAYIFMKEEVSYYNMPVNIFLTKPLVSKKIVTLILDFLKEISNGNEIKLYDNSFLTYELIGSADLKLSISQEYSYIVDMSVDMEIIWTNIRRRYKSMINWCIKNINYKIITSDNFDRDEFLKLKQFHLETAGKSTRSDRSWEIQMDMIANGEAFLINGYLEDKLVSSGWYMLGEVTYYGVGVYDRELMNTNRGIAHGSMYKAIEYVHQKGGKGFLLGYYEDYDKLSEKEQQIFNFKRGFSHELMIKNLLLLNY